jgi:1-deoxy-D-xylulose-5-phosphate reductoisomerase
MTRGVAVLGSTGSVGTTALRVLARHADRFRVTALTAHSNAALLREQVDRFHPAYVGIVHDQAGRSNTTVDEWRTGPECLIEAAVRADVDIVLNAVVGAAGLDATLAALDSGKRVALANKETLVMGGSLVAEARDRGGGHLVPVDSEHSAILQCIAGRPEAEVRRLVLTASGGPFRDWPADRIESATLDDALRHPTWRMGRKITVDSATLANKALEVIEAHYLFGLPFDRIDVVVHPQSVVHSLVEFVDGSVLAQLGAPSMEVPVLYSLTHPERAADAAVPAFDPVAASPLTFERVRDAAFPALKLGIDAGRHGGAAPAVFNAANEEAVAQFTAGCIRFGDIARSISDALDTFGDLPARTRAEVLAADAAARRRVREMLSC